ncbi:MAG: FAD-binding oxidoreductase [Burkholderiales bacterium]|nr:FAD-binding oxidoreductase [Burkholderiales bacterium]
MHKIDLTSGREFTAEPQVTLLDAASSAGVVLPYSCRTGRCSTCKAQVLRGQTRPLSDEIGLGSEDIEAGWILTCVRAAETDVSLDIEDLGAVQLPNPKTLPCRIAALDRLAPDVMRVKLRLPLTANFTFIPGQYIDVIGINGTRRSYSLANGEFLNSLLELHVRAVPGGTMSDYWFNQAKPNDLLRLNGPLGTFFLRDNANADVFFLATGTGIAPFKAILESLTQVPEVQRPNSITVLWGGRKPEDLYIDVATIPGQHRYIPVISRSNEGWKGGKGYVQDHLLSMTPDLSNAAVYACGSDSMINTAMQSLCSAGLPSKRFYSDAFVSSGIAPST